MTGYTGFYRFLGLHSLLIGLFPFFIPVYLYNSGLPLAWISLFIAISGAIFVFSIRLWEICAIRLSITTLMALTLMLELLLLAINFGFTADARATIWFVASFALTNGLYNCFFWTTQRTLFLDLINSQNSGRQYGNFQIFVMVFLKIGIFTGGFLLENHGFQAVFWVSALLVVSAIWYLQLRAPCEHLKPQLPLDLRKIATFKDDYHSRRIFIIDGLFLFLESHFWTISLFLLAEQNYTRFGIIVIALAALFALMFFIVKNTIDRIMGARLYQIAVVLYALSWWLRPAATEELPTQWLLAMLLTITFFTSFFRLTFNKRFYDIAKLTSARQYLLIKSYYTQAAVALIFGLLGLLVSLLNNDSLAIRLVYAGAGLSALVYGFYKPPSAAQYVTGDN